MPSKDLILLTASFLFGSITTGTITTLYYKNKIKTQIIKEQELTAEIQKNIIKINDKNSKKSKEIIKTFEEKLNSGKKIEKQEQYFTEVDKIYG